MARKRWYHEYDGTIDFALIGLVTVGTTVCIALCTLLIAAMVDTVQSVRAEPNVVACHQVQMNAHRFTFSDSVICVPHAQRRDTLAVEQLPVR